MSRYNKLLWMVVAVLAAVMIFQFFYMKKKPAYKQTYYISEYTFSNDSTAVSIHSVARFVFDKPEDLKKAVDQFGKLSHKDKLKAYSDMFTNLSKNTKTTIKVLDYQSTMTTLKDNVLQIEENGVISGIVTYDGDQMKVSMGKVGMKLDENSRVTFNFPQSDKIISVSPTPTVANVDQLIWKGPMDLKFPEVKYKK